MVVRVMLAVVIELGVLAVAIAEVVPVIAAVKPLIVIE